MSHKGIIDFVLIIAMAVSGAAQGIYDNGQDDGVFSEEITVTATNNEESIDDVPLPVTVITKKEMVDSQADTVPTMLQRVPGVLVLQSGGAGSSASVFTRGAPSTGTLVMFDGVRLNSPYFGGFDFSQISTSGLQRIEVARGPYSALWGADAVGGAINFIPDRGEGGFTGNLMGEGGDDDWKRYEGSISTGSDGYDLFASGISRSGNYELENSDFDLEQFVVDAGLKFGNGSRVAFLFFDTESELGIPYVTPGSLTPYRRQKAKQRTMAIPLTWRLSDKWSLEVVGSQVEYSLELNDPDDPWGYTDTETTGDTTQVRLTSHHAFKNHTFTWGGEWREDNVTASNSYGTDIDDVTTSMTSLLLQDVWRFGDSLTMVLGARWDDSDEWGSETSPRVNLGWAFTKTLELRLGYGMAYRQPSIGELFYPGSGNAELQPETSTSYEIGIAGRGTQKTSPRYQLNGFSTTIDDMIQFDYVSFSNLNIGEAEIKGVEAAIDIPHTNELISSLQATWVDASDGDGDPLLRRADWSGSYSLHGSLLPWLDGDLTVIYVGERDDIDPTTYATVKADSFVTGNLSFTMKVWTNLNVTVRSTNIFDEEYAEVYGYPAPGRRYYAGFRADL